MAVLLSSLLALSTLPATATAPAVSPVFAWTIISLVVLAHFGWHLAAYNRLNSLGWKRKTIKRTEKILFAEMWISLFIIGLMVSEPVQELLTGDGQWDRIPIQIQIYGLVCLVAGGILGALWVAWRPILGVHHAPVKRRIETEQADAATVQRYARTQKARMASRIPGNQMFDLAIEHVEIPLQGLPPSLDGYRIAHLSDIHLTGHVHPSYIANVIEQANQFDSEMMALTGDIVDVQECIDWLPELFQPANAEDGCYFILGNHDTRVSDPNAVRQAMQSVGWTDVGGRCELASCRDAEILIAGNEHPWFGRPTESEIEQEAMNCLSENCLQLCLSHSPDQFDWARQHYFDLMLCGHTHGGQGRLPLVGPILSPSWHGSRWASGDFYRAPTTMHVSRGLGGVHLLRLRCRPELSLITLRCQPS
ncbi:metallophosphoesterase [Neorhodopirellula lusitana]|uniref:metallophosphoesterase n=1 Tax=Neorhodopirellula lusitana TaxID=445327 RepID=UPI00384EA342